ncbi:MAG: transposase [Bacteroidota bacterium]
MKNFWGIDLSTLEMIGDKLQVVFDRYRHLLKTKTRDTSAQGLNYLKGCLLLETDRNYANIDRKISGNPMADGQAIQQFMSDSPWSADTVFQQVRQDIKSNEALQGGTLNFDETGDECSGKHKAGAARQYLGRLGKVDMGQVGVLSSYSLDNLWLLTDAELYFPKKWFEPAYQAQWKKLHIPVDKRFATKLAIAREQFDRANNESLPFDWVGGDAYYGQSLDFRWHIGDQNKQYLFSVPKDMQVWLANPLEDNSPANNSQTVEQLATTATFETIQVRWTERGMMELPYSFIPVWTFKHQGKVADWQARQEMLVIRKEADGKISYALSNGVQTAKLILAQQRSERYFVERTIQDCKSELGADELQALKYRAYMHCLAMNAIALTFLASVKLEQRKQFAPIDEVQQAIEVEQLPDLSLANVKELLSVTMPLPQLSKQQACELVVHKLYKRSVSTQSRRKRQKRRQNTSKIT